MRSLMFVTPELARNWLRGSFQFNDRDTFRENVEKLCARYRQGVWKARDDHKAMHVQKGRMSDGNHRAHMVIKLGYEGVLGVWHMVESDGSLDLPDAVINNTGRWRPFQGEDKDGRPDLNESFYGHVPAKPTLAGGRWDPLGRGAL